MGMLIFLLIDALSMVVTAATQFKDKKRAEELQKALHARDVSIVEIDEALSFLSSRQGMPGLANKIQSIKAQREKWSKMTDEQVLSTGIPAEHKNIMLGDRETRRLQSGDATAGQERGNYVPKS